MNRNHMARAITPCDASVSSAEETASFLRLCARCIPVLAVYASQLYEKSIRRRSFVASNFKLPAVSAFKQMGPQMQLRILDQDRAATSATLAMEFAPRYANNVREAARALTAPASHDRSPLRNLHVGPHARQLREQRVAASSGRVAPHVEHF